MERSSLNKAILIADRGYENYNVMAHAINKGWKFVVRIKDKNSNGIASGLNLPKTDIFDIDLSFLACPKLYFNKQKHIIIILSNDYYVFCVFTSLLT